MTELSTKALTTLSRVADELEITPGADARSDRIIRALIEEASEEFALATGRQFFNKSDHVEYAKGYGSPILMVRDHLPIESITEIVFDNGSTTVEVDDSDYMIENAGAGMIRRVGSVTGKWTFTGHTNIGTRMNQIPGSERPLYKVTYSGGYVGPQQAHLDDTLTRDLPRDIERAIISKVVQQYRRQGRDTDVVSESVGNASIRYDSSTGGRDVSPTEKMWMKTVSRHKRGGFR